MSILHDHEKTLTRNKGVLCTITGLCCPQHDNYKQHQLSYFNSVGNSLCTNANVSQPGDFHCKHCKVIPIPLGTLLCLPLQGLDFFLLGGWMAPSWLGLLSYPLGAYFATKLLSREDMDNQARPYP